MSPTSILYRFVWSSQPYRDEMQRKFDRLCKAIEAMAFVKGEEKYLPLAGAINEEVKNALAVAK